VLFHILIVLFSSAVSAGSSVTSPSLDFQNLNTKQLLKRLFITRKLLSMKKLSLKNKVMAVNLETLLPQAFSPSLVPSNNGPSEEESRYSDLFSPASMYGSDKMLPLSNSVDFDPSLAKADYLLADGSTQNARESPYPAEYSGKLLSSQLLLV
jgi:hypothetical protein